MQKKVIAISASPRKEGNSDILCDQFLKGAAESGHTVEKINLRQAKLGYCMACYACRETKKCIQKDAGNEILEKMVAADVIVFSTPVYFYSASGQLKTLIDRTFPRFSELKGKAYLIVTAAAPTHDGIEGAVSDYKNFLRMTPELIDSGHIYGLGAWEKGDILTNPAFTQAHEVGKSL